MLGSIKSIITDYPIASITTTTSVAIILMFFYTRKEARGLSNKLRLTLVLITLACGISFPIYIKGVWDQLGLENPTSVFQLSIIFSFVVEYIILYLIFIFSETYKAGGIRKLEMSIESGIYDGMIFWLTIMLPAGLVVGLLAGAQTGDWILALISSTGALLFLGLAIGILIGYKKKDHQI